MMHKPPTTDSNVLKVLMVASSFPSSRSDWRAVFMRQLADALARHSELEPTIWAPLGEADERVLFDLRGNEAQWLASLMINGGIAHLLRTRPLKGLLTAVELLWHLRAVYRRNSQVDIRHVNWLQNALTLPNDGKPLLVTVLGSDLALLKLIPVQIAVKRLLRTRKVIICPNAAWMIKPLKNALGDSADIREVAFGIDAHWYEVKRCPIVTPHRWLAVTRLTKGKLGDLFEWAAPMFSDGQRELHLFGPMQEETQIPKWVHYHGPATPQQLREHWFPQASGLITLSRHAEGRPQVILEAMAAGLPIIASNITAHTSFLQHDKTAWLCSNPEQFKHGVVKLEDENTNTRIGYAAHCWAHETIGTWDDCAERYCTLYRELLGAYTDE